jgi:[ribosomal protein S18]-alanine N-acetyltransferase
MTYEFNVMTQEQAENIAFNWHYEGEYSFYDMEADEEDLAEFLDPKKRGTSTYAVTERNELVEFLSVIKISDKTFDIGLGMRPDLTGKGKGIGFLREGMDFIQSEFSPRNITLSVATFNQRAIKAYRKVGFTDKKTFTQDTNGRKFEFLKMEYEIK